MKFLISIVNFFVFSNLFVALCVTVFTHTTYIIYNLPTKNLDVILLMVFSFTLFTYNGQRLFRLNQKKISPQNLGERLQWVVNHKIILTIIAILSGIIGLICTFFIHPYCFIILFPLGGLSIFYVAPLFPFNKKSPSLRDIPYLKVIIIGFVWSLAIAWLPFIDSQITLKEVHYTTLLIAFLQVFLFVIAITLPFDVRDMHFDKSNNLKTTPQLIGVKNTILLSQILILSSITLLFISEINNYYLYSLFLGHIITMLIIAFTNNNRKELFYAGLVESTVLIIYLLTLISNCLVIKQ